MAMQEKASFDLGDQIPFLDQESVTNSVDVELQVPSPLHRPHKSRQLGNQKIILLLQATFLILNLALAAWN